jgi:uncharacterized protein YbjT (DUF2867 family)
MQRLVAVTGATGAVGGAVARRLADRGLPQRLVVRDPTRLGLLDGADVRTVAGYGAREDMEAALRGVDTLLLIPAAESADRIAEHKAAVDAAVAAGVRRIVYLSVQSAAADAVFTLARDHWATEEHIRASGLAHAFPRMSLYVDFVPRMIGADGVIAGPAGDGRVALVSRADVSDVLVALLATEQHDGDPFDVTGREALTFAEIAAITAAASGKRIVFRDETPAEARASRAAYGAPDWQLEAWISTYAAVAAGELAALSDAVARLAGHVPVTLAEFLRARPACLAHVRS